MPDPNTPLPGSGGMRMNKQNPPLLPRVLECIDKWEERGWMSKKVCNNLRKEFTRNLADETWTDNDS